MCTSSSANSPANDRANCRLVGLKPGATLPIPEAGDTGNARLASGASLFGHIGSRQYSWTGTNINASGSLSHLLPRLAGASV
jgi:hypothetical protein